MKTTLERAKEKIHERTVNNLQDLLERTYDAEAGYKKAMELAKDPNYEEFFMKRAANRAVFATELDQEIRNLNETPIESGSTKAALHRGWMDTRAWLSTSTDEAILEECIRGEKASLDTYNEILVDESFNPELRNVLMNQMLQIRRSLDTVKDLKATEEVVNSF